MASDGASILLLKTNRVKVLSWENPKIFTMLKVHSIRTFVYEKDVGSYLCWTAVKIKNQYLQNRNGITFLVSLFGIGLSMQTAEKLK